ncbi:formate--tetrahydrofolate ligase, partial [Bacillus licheniformis]
MKSHLSDIEIAQRTELKPITEIARKLNINDEEIECFGCTKAKISL